jgi:uncharacterized protein YcfJ
VGLGKAAKGIGKFALGATGAFAGAFIGEAVKGAGKQISDQQDYQRRVGEQIEMENAIRRAVRDGRK